ncbi:hypothetical protein JIN84_20620 [Luteolibacter yonseiensis]|uniref:Uncharacterized protein n=1 Tax=Luteolibacter yonseiensis TaxID=1144680 RepID=A0A934R6U2_9BACT|nr:hypothetical protein [Luteolibacter yonseiensis]MBK1818039.1 hypothetical protein [Luteolibacter yonseiensis]
MTRQEQPPTAPGLPSPPVAVKAEAALPDDPAIIRIATIAGRSTEARKKLQKLLAAEAKDDEIADWLALALFSDPVWLDKFILTLPEDRRVALARLTIFKLGALSPDAAWELIRHSPYARQAALADVEIEHRKGLEILGYCGGSPLVADTLLDPSLGFSEKDIARQLRFPRGEENARRILEEWKSGRWKGEPPEFVRRAWFVLQHTDKDGLREMEKTFPPGFSNDLDQFKTLHEQQELVDKAPAGAPPQVEDLAKLKPAEFTEYLRNSWNSSTSIPLTTLTQLPPELRKIGIERYLQYNMEFRPEAARQCVDQLESLDLTSQEKQSLLKDAAGLVWGSEGDIRSALDWAGRIPDADERAKFEEKLLTELAQEDPEEALDYVATLPAGALREKIARIATTFQP